MEDFSKVFTVEIYGSKGWEVVFSGSSWDEAIEISRNWCEEFQVRITSPMKVW